MATAEFFRSSFLDGYHTPVRVGLQDFRTDFQVPLYSYQNDNRMPTVHKVHERFQYAPSVSSAEGH